MNRIILIGNGFDLAHGLKTGYKDFIEWLLEKEATKVKEHLATKDVANIRRGRAESYESDNISVISESFNTWYTQPNNSNYQDFLFNKKHYNLRVDYKNLFLRKIIEKTHLQNWVDIEEEYHQEIKNIIQKKSEYSLFGLIAKEDKASEKKTPIAKLNDDFEKIKQELEVYLSEITSELSLTDDMYDLFYDAFKLKEFAKNKEKSLVEYIIRILKDETLDFRVDSYYKELQERLRKDMINYYRGEDRHVTDERMAEYLKVFGYLHGESYKFYPQNNLMLNFNYTKTESLYSDFKEYKDAKSIWPDDLPYFHIQTIHIHGELNSKKNPIIFGYGDELANEYKEIENQSDKEYFKNIKSIKYLQADNYKKMLDFADSDYFQIYIFGHSCGNSDRTLLNTLFEHENCVSIKPFYHEKTENGITINDYEDIIINMSRNFKNKASFREKVVNKTYCQPLPQMQNPK
ncbi:MAG: bacteriophage abortive infection AbiH family protein [Lentimicrobiaceae bacterium]|nr:bacteriophage abortive infection AbiH family protein [Lentimicrobiaceae bacterium]